MADDPDAPWKPGYTGPEPVAPTRSSDVAETSDVEATWSPPSFGDGESVESGVGDRSFGDGESVESGVGDRSFGGEDRDQVGSAASPWSADGAPHPADPPVAPVDPRRVGSPPPVPPAVDDEAPRWQTSSEAEEPGEPPTRTRRPIVIAAVVAAVLAIGALVVSRWSSEDSTALASIAPGTLPESAEQRWEWDPGDGRPTDEFVVAGDTVILTVEEGPGDEWRLVGLDTTTGEVRWERRDLDVPGGVRPVLATPEAFVVQGGFDDNRVFGIDPATGETVWVRSAEMSAAFAPFTDEVLMEASFELQTGVTFVDPATGEERGRVDGVLTTTNLDGEWLLVDEEADELVVVDVESDAVEGTRLGPADQTIGTLATDVAMIGQRVLVFDEAGGVVELGRSPDGERHDVTIVDRRQDVPDDGLLVDGRLTSSDAIGGVGVGGDRGVLFVETEQQLVGVRLDGPELFLEWSRPMEFLNVQVTDRGVLIHGADELDFAPVGDATDDLAETNRSYLVDAVTGETVVSWERGRTFEQVTAAANGVLVLEPSGDRFESDLVGYRSDGESMWRIEGDVDAVAVGDRVVVAAGRFDDRYVVRGYGS